MTCESLESKIITCKWMEKLNIISPMLLTLHSSNMTTLAAQVVFHPVVTHSLKFGGTTIGRDKVSASNTSYFQKLIILKLYRAIQYVSRFIAWYFEYKGRKSDAVRWIALKTHLGMARKCKAPTTLRSTWHNYHAASDAPWKTNGASSGSPSHFRLGWILH